MIYPNKLVKIVTQNYLQIVSIHDRPEKSTLGKYVYLIECENGSYNEFFMERGGKR